MKKYRPSAPTVYERLFPERQIILRSSGAVRGAVVSPRSQVCAALLTCAAAIWCVYATANVLGQGLRRDEEIATVARDRAKYSRWLNQARGQAIAASQYVEERARRIDDFTRQLESRHQVLRWLLEYAHGASQTPPTTWPERNEIVSAAMIQLSDPGDEVRLVALAPERAAWPGSAIGRAPGDNSDVRSSADAEVAGERSSIEFGAYLRDPVLAERVAEVAQRVAAARSDRGLPSTFDRAAARSERR